jgi:tetrahydromethanopterin S-methyltransferase subunit B
MNDIFEILDDLRELKTLYSMNELCLLDFEEKMAKYNAIVDKFEREMAPQEDLFDNVPV